LKKISNSQNSSNPISPSALILSLTARRSLHASPPQSAPHGLSPPTSRPQPPHLTASCPHALNLTASRLTPSSPHGLTPHLLSPHLTASRPQPHGLALTSRPHLLLSLSIPFRCCPSLPRSHRRLKARSHTTGAPKPPISPSPSLRLSDLTI
jgi:hypothetical protein